MNNADNPSADTPPEPEAPEVTGDSTELAKLLAEKGLVVYRVQEGEEGDYCVPEHSNLPTPPGWEFLPCGDAFITRTVKKGPHWVLCGKYNKKQGYTPVFGVVAPATAIAGARALAVETETKRALACAKAAPRRQRKEDEYRRQFEEACLRFLGFAAAHTDLAGTIAAETAAHACETGSGRVGRTTRVALDEKAALAVRAHIRHKCLAYEHELEKLRSECGGEIPDDFYREVRSDIGPQVDAFLERHRKSG
ncbi:MAG: DUF2293 domain-containing protein [Planctomycetota bacterium]